jgi:hypothetical protein
VILLEYRVFCPSVRDVRSREALIELSNLRPWVACPASFINCVSFRRKTPEGVKSDCRDQRNTRNNNRVNGRLLLDSAGEGGGIREAGSVRGRAEDEGVCAGEVGGTRAGGAGFV